MEDNDRLEDAPREPHLALSFKDGSAMAIKVGTIIYLIEDPKRPDKIYPMVLRAVNHRYLDFDAVSSDRKSTRRVRFRADWKGKHETVHKQSADNAKKIL